MQWHEAIKRWLTWLGAAGSSPDSLRLRRYQLTRLARDVQGQPFTLDAARLEQWLARQRWSPETRRSEIAGIRSFYRWGRLHGLVDDDPTARLPRTSPAAGEPRPAPEAAVDRAIAEADDRTRLMLVLAARHGLRRGEISRIHRDDLLPGIGGWSLLVHGKGGKPRTVPVMSDVAEAIRSADGWVFPNGLGSHLTPGHVGVLITRALPAGVTPHMLRHRFATVVYRRTLDIRNLQRLLGHASVATTQRYAAPDDGQLRQVLAAAA